MKIGGRTVSYAVVAVPDPGILIRILDLFALRDLVPCRVKARTLGDRLLIDVSVADLEDGEAERIAARMRSLVRVISVRLEQMALRSVA